MWIISYLFIFLWYCLYMFNYSKKLVLILLFFSFFFTTTLYPFTASAQEPAPQSNLLLNTQSVFNPSGIGISPYSYPSIKPFGGRIISMQPCKTPAGIMLTIGEPRGGQFLLTDSSQVFNYGVFANGVWTLGTADPSTVTCKGRSGLFSPGISTAMTAASAAISVYSLYYTTTFSLTSIGLDTTIGLSQIGMALGIGGFISKFGFGKKLDTLGHPHVIKMVGTSLTP